MTLILDLLWAGRSALATAANSPDAPMQTHESWGLIVQKAKRLGFEAQHKPQWQVQADGILALSFLG